jgi:hypothetical protein
MGRDHAGAPRRRRGRRRRRAAVPARRHQPDGAGNGSPPGTSRRPRCRPPEAPHALPCRGRCRRPGLHRGGSSPTSARPSDSARSRCSRTTHSPTRRPGHCRSRSGGGHGGSQASVSDCVSCWRSRSPEWPSSADWCCSGRGPSYGPRREAVPGDSDGAGQVAMSAGCGWPVHAVKAAACAVVGSSTGTTLRGGLGSASVTVRVSTRGPRRTTTSIVASGS